MQSWDKKQDCKVEFYKSSNGDLEIRYFDYPHDSSYFSWRLPKIVVEDLISLWGKLRQSKNTDYPIKINTKICEFCMHTEKSINIRELDSLGRYKPIAWSLPRGAAEKLINWHKRHKTKKRRHCFRIDIKR